MAPDNAAAISFLKNWLPAGPWAVVSDRAGNWSSNELSMFTFNQTDQLDAWLTRHQSKDNIYFVRNLINTSMDITTTPKKHQISSILGISIDVDLEKRGAGPEEYDRLLDELRTMSYPPTAIVFSGGGYQAHWLFETPLPPKLYADAVEEQGRQMALHFGSDHVHSIQCLMRLPGTINVLSDVKRATGRSPALAYLLEADWSRRYAVTAPIQPEYTPRQLSSLTEEWRARILTGSTEWLTGTDKTRSTALFMIALHLLEQGWADHQVIDILLDPTNGISASVLEKSNPKYYATYQVNRAKIKLAQTFNKTAKGKIIANDYQNIKKALFLLEYSLTYDEFADRYLYEHPTQDHIQVLNDNIMVDLRVRDIPNKFKFAPPENFYKDAVPAVARERRFHPVNDYLSTLTWDSKPRIDTWLTDYGGAEDTPYSRAVGRLILLAAVCRVRTPGCKFDEMLVLQSAQQGTNKSSAIALLAVRPEWFTDSLLLGSHSREALEQLLGKWLIEFSDLAGMRRGSIEELKKFLAQQYDRARLAYGRLVTERPRSCVFFGTTNSTRYLQDETNRRFWPVTVTQFDLPSLVRVREQLWAEAAHYQAQGESIRLDPSLYKIAAEEQAKRRVEDPWLPLLQASFGDLTGKVVINDVWKILGKQTGSLTYEDNRRVGEAMRELNWVRKHTSLPGSKAQLYWCYVRGDNFHEVNRPIYVDRDPITQQVTVGYSPFDGLTPSSDFPTSNELPF